MRVSDKDEHGLPTINKLEFVLATKDYKLTSDQLDALIERVLLIHDLTYAHLLDKLPKHNG